MLYSFLRKYINPVLSYVYLVTEPIFNIFLYVFISIPWYIYGEFVKPYTSHYIFIAYGVIIKYMISIQGLVFIFNFLHKNLTILHKNFYTLFVFFWKKIIDFAFFDFYRNFNFFKKKFNKIISFFLKFFIFYLLFYCN